MNLFCTKKPLLVLLFIAVLWVPTQTNAQEIAIARIKYSGGGDWYNDPSSLNNLLSFAASSFPTTLSLNYRDVDLGDSDLYLYPFAFLTGHGGLSYNKSELDNLRDYLDYGGFLYIDDDYGLDESVRKMAKDLFPDEALVVLPFDHAIYKAPFNFSAGLPKIHEHNGLPPKGLGIFRNGRLVLFYSYESNLADGWADPEVHKDPQSIRELALKMGTNILLYAINGE
jgi:hypothetical protein